jgi:hypothetical protein
MTIWPCIPAEAARTTEKQSHPVAKADGKRDDYQRMKLMRVMDKEGWGEPVEAFRLLIPSDWSVEGGVRWVSDLGCPPNIIQVQFRATAPDGVTAIEFLPNYTWASTDDPMMQNVLQQQAQNQMGCAFVVANISVGMSAAGALQGNLNATSRTYQLTGQDVFAMRAPKGQLDSQSGLFSLSFGSIHSKFRTASLNSSARRFGASRATSILAQTSVWSCPPATNRPSPHYS